LFYDLGLMRIWLSAKGGGRGGGAKRNPDGVWQGCVDEGRKKKKERKKKAVLTLTRSKYREAFGGEKMRSFCRRNHNSEKTGERRKEGRGGGKHHMNFPPHYEFPEWMWWGKRSKSGFSSLKRAVIQ